MSVRGKLQERCNSSGSGSALRFAPNGKWAPESELKSFLEAHCQTPTMYAIDSDSRTTFQQNMPNEADFKGSHVVGALGHFCESDSLTSSNPNDTSGFVLSQSEADRYQGNSNVYLDAFQGSIKPTGPLSTSGQSYTDPTYRVDTTSSLSEDLRLKLNDLKLASQRATLLSVHGHPRIKAAYVEHMYFDDILHVVVDPVRAFISFLSHRECTYKMLVGGS